jgi:hypothetical protein
MRIAGAQQRLKNLNFGDSVDGGNLGKHDIVATARESASMPFDVREIQPTPNPNAVKFVLDRPISERPESFLNAEQATGHPIAKELFAIAGVTSVLLLGDFVTVNKDASAAWPTIKRRVKQVLGQV